MNGKRKAAIIIPIVVFVAAMSAVFSWPALRPYISYLVPVGNLTAPFENGNPPIVPSNNTGKENGSNTSEKILIGVLSSPSAFTFVDKWIAQYNIEDNLATASVDYSREADNIAYRRYANVSELLSDYDVDLVITGSVPVQNNQLGSNTDFLPISPQAVAVVYNVPGFPDVPSGLRLNPSTLSAIFSGNITFWDDSRIVELNPNMTLPHEAIEVVQEAREGSASKLLRQYLASPNTTANWRDTSLTAEYPTDLAAVVRRTPNSIGYVEFSYAVQTRMTYADLQNSDGDFVSPSSDSIGKAILNGTVFDYPVTNTSMGGEKSSANIPRTLIGKLGNGSYPIVGFYYAAFHNVDDSSDGNTTTGNTSTKQSAADLVKWIVNEKGQTILGNVGYEPIYERNEKLAIYLEEAFD